MSKKCQKYPHQKRSSRHWPSNLFFCVFHLFTTPRVPILKKFQNFDFSLFLKKTSFFLVKTVEKIDIFDQLQAKMTFQNLKNSLPFLPFLRGKKFLDFFWGAKSQKSTKIGSQMKKIKISMLAFLSL